MLLVLIAGKVRMGASTSGRSNDVRSVLVVDNDWREERECVFIEEMKVLVK